MDTQDVTRRILVQRMYRYPDPGPDLGPAGSARFRVETARLRVAFAQLRKGAAAEALKRVQRFAGWHRLYDVQWVVVPQRPGEEELPDALTSAGFERIESLLLMASEGPLHTRPNPDVTVTPIETFAEMVRYEQGSRRNFFDEPQPYEVMVEQRARERWREQERGWCRYYQAMLRGRMVGGCYISLFEDVPTIFGVYTEPEARHNGVATAMLTRAVAEVITPQKQAYCLFVKHGNPAERLYRELGFAPLVDELTYAWRPW